MEPAKLFQILKDGAVKVLHSICQQVWKTQQWLLDWKMSVFNPNVSFQSQRKTIPKNVQTTAQLHSFHMLVGEGSGNPRQYSCLENLMYGGTWQAAVHGVAKSQTWLSNFTFMLVRLCSKTFKLGFKSTWTENFQMYKRDLEKAKETEIKLPTSTGS